MKPMLFLSGRLVAIILALVLLNGCTALMAREPMTQSKTLPDAPDLAYQKATRAMTRLGGQLTLANQDQRVLSAVVHNAVVLNVHVVPTETGSRVDVSGTLLPDKIVLGTFDEVDQYLALVQ